MSDNNLSVHTSKPAKKKTRNPRYWRLIWIQIAAVLNVSLLILGTMVSHSDLDISSKNTIMLAATIVIFLYVLVAIFFMRKK